jgi:hypothetical protein
MLVDPTPVMADTKVVIGRELFMRSEGQQIGAKVASNGVKVNEA